MHNGKIVSIFARKYKKMHLFKSRLHCLKNQIIAD